jgi:hypothetical protein
LFFGFFLFVFFFGSFPQNRACTLQTKKKKTVATPKTTTPPQQQSHIRFRKNSKTIAIKP